jgi:hypothetical protein
MICTTSNGAAVASGLLLLLIVGAIAGSLYAIIELVSLWRIFGKAGQHRWACLVPIYNVVVWLHVARWSGWWLILLLIPIVNVIVALIVCIDIARLFSKGTGFGVGLWLLGFIFYPILAFGRATYQAPPRVPSAGRIVAGAAIACGVCAMPVPWGARFCPSCGASVAATIPCPHCGQPLAPTGGFCTACGAAVTVEGPSPDGLGEPWLAGPAADEATTASLPAPLSQLEQQGEAARGADRGAPPRGHRGLIVAVAVILIAVIAAAGALVAFHQSRRHRSSAASAGSTRSLTAPSPRAAPSPSAYPLVAVTLPVVVLPTQQGIADNPAPMYAERVTVRVPRP